MTIELCGKILDAKELTVDEVSDRGNLRRDLRPDLYESCLNTANTFAAAILRSSETLFLVR